MSTSTHLTGRAHAARRLATLTTLLLLGAAAACHPAPLAEGPTPNAGPGATRVLTAEMIRRYQSTNVWDLLRECNSGFRLTESGAGLPLALQSTRGPSSLVLRDSDVPVVILDGVRLTDPFVLRDLATSAVKSIRFLNGIDGTTFYGTNSGAGVIVVNTRLSVTQ